MGLFDFIGNALGGGDQSDFISQLKAQMSGTGAPSPALAALQQQTQAGQENAAGAIGGVKGINPALQAKMILDAQQRMQQQSVGQGVQLKAQEQLGAQGLLGNAINAKRQSDIGLTTGIIGGIANGAGAAMGMPPSSGGGGSPDFSGDWTGGAAHGALVPGRAPVRGDSPRNDIVPANLSPGEVVLPRSVVQAEDAPEKAAEFVRAIRRKKDGPEGYGKVLAKTRELEQRLSAMEAMYRGGAVR